GRLPPPVQGLLRPGRPGARGRRGDLRNQQRAAQQQGTNPFHKTTSTTQNGLVLYRRSGTPKSFPRAWGGQKSCRRPWVWPAAADAPLRFTIPAPLTLRRDTRCTADGRGARPPRWWGSGPQDRKSVV